MNEEMNEGRIREIAEEAFKTRFSDVKLVRVNVKPALGPEEQRYVDVTIIYDGKYEQLNGDGLMRVQSDIVSKAWRNVEHDVGFPLVHFVAKSDLMPRELRDLTTV